MTAPQVVTLFVTKSIWNKGKRPLGLAKNTERPAFDDKTVLEVVFIDVESVGVLDLSAWKLQIL